MREQESRNFSPDMIREFFTAKIKKTGLMKRNPIETLEVYMSIGRPFRNVQFTTKRGNVYTSLVDEILSEFVSEFEECLLLWRPKYVDIQIPEFTESPSSELELAQKSRVAGVIEMVVQKRKESGEKLLELDPTIKKIQTNLQASVGFILPKPPSSLWKDEMELAKWREESGIFLASSLVTNCPSNEEIEKIELKDKVHVYTHVGIYTNTESGRKRIIALETTRANNLRDALKYGRALTRFFEISEIEPDILVKN